MTRNSDSTSNGEMSQSQERWLMPAIPASGRQRQEDHCKFEGSLDYTMRSRPAGRPSEETLSQNKTSGSPASNSFYPESCFFHLTGSSYPSLSGRVAPRTPPKTPKPMVLKFLIKDGVVLCITCTHPPG